MVNGLHIQGKPSDRGCFTLAHYFWMFVVRLEGSSRLVGLPVSACHDLGVGTFTSRQLKQLHGLINSSLSRPLREEVRGKVCAVRRRNTLASNLAWATEFQGVADCWAS